MTWRTAPALVVYSTDAEPAPLALVIGGRPAPPWPPCGVLDLDPAVWPNSEGAT